MTDPKRKEQKSFPFPRELFGYLALLIAVMLAGFSGPSNFFLNATVTLSALIIAVGVFIGLCFFLPYQLKSIRRDGQPFRHVLYWLIVFLFIGVSVWAGDAGRDFLITLTN